MYKRQLHVLFEQEYNLLEAENGEQALMLIKQYRESLAAVLLDVVMPVKDGFQVMQEMGQNGLMTNIPVIIITSEDSMENEVRAFDTVSYTHLMEERLMAAYMVEGKELPSPDMKSVHA